MSPSGIRAQLADPYALAVNLPYAVALSAVVAETAWRAVRAGRGAGVVLRPARTAALMGLGALGVGVAYTALLRMAWSAASAFELPGARGFWAAHPVAAAGAAFVAWDLSGFIYHWIGHHTGFGWAAHQPHHSGAGYDMTLGLRQSWTPFHGLLSHPLLAVAGFDLRTVIVCAAVSSCWQVLQHTSLPVRLPRAIEAVIMTPASHRHHHGTGSGAVNLGPVLTLWDRLAGTWVPADRPAPARYGPSDEAARGAVVVELAGWKELVTGRLSRNADDDADHLGHARHHEHGDGAPWPGRPSGGGGTSSIAGGPAASWPMPTSGRAIWSSTSEREREPSLGSSSSPAPE